MSADDDIANGIAAKAAAALGGASDAVPVSDPSAAHSAHAKRATRGPSGRFERMYPEGELSYARRQRRRFGDQPPTRKSKVTNGKRLFLAPTHSPEARRFRDILAAVCSDLGGFDNMTEGARQLARRASALSLACEKLEAQLVGAPEAVEERIKQLAGGLSPHQIIGECGRLLHAIARKRGGNDGVGAIAALPDDKLAIVTDMLKAAADISAKAISVGSEHGADLELLSLLSDRCGRCFMRLGIKRVPRDINAIGVHQSPETWSPLRQTLRDEAGPVEDAQSPGDPELFDMGDGAVP